MSNNILHLIPTDPYFDPTQSACIEALGTSEKHFPKATHIRCQSYDYPQFIDPGSNLSEVQCPVCDSKINFEWWSDRVNESLVNEYRDLEITTPCCTSKLFLNNLTYIWPAGFARFVLSIENPDVPLITEQYLDVLQTVLSTNLRVIWGHY